MARTRKTQRGNNLGIFLDKVLTGGVDIAKLLDEPVALASMSGIKLTKREKEQLVKLPLADILDRLYAQLGGTDKRFLLAKRKPSGVRAEIPPTLIIPVVGVVVAVAVVAIILSGPKTTIVDKSPMARKKL